MAQRRFGPTQGAGTVVIEKESQKTITPSALGGTAYVGPMERGAPQELIAVSGKRDLLAKTGGLIPEGLLPDCAQDFWDHSDGAGLLFLYRVTDLKEEKAWLKLYDRSGSRNNVGTLKAKDGGGWGGRRQRWAMDITDSGDLDDAQHTVDLPIAFTVKKDQLKGGWLTLSGASKTYKIRGNDASDGTTKTTVSLQSDATPFTDYGAATNKEVLLSVPSLDGYGQSKHLAAVILDGQLNPSTEWGLEIYLNGALVYNQYNLSMDPDANNYWEEVLNEDENNHYVEAVDNWGSQGMGVGAVNRPANWYGVVNDAQVTKSTVDLGNAKAAVEVDASLAGSNTIADFTFGADLIPDEYEITYKGAGTDWEIVSLNQQALRDFYTPLPISGGTPYAAPNKFSIGFTITESGPADGQKFVVRVFPLHEDEAIDGKIYFPDESFAPSGGWLITDNAESTLKSSNADFTNNGGLSGDVNVRLEYKQQFGFGYDGLGELDTTHFTAAFDVLNSPFNQLKDQGYGLVKFATPGITRLGSDHSGVDEILVEKAGINFAETKNHQYREEIPKGTTDEFSAKAYVQDTIGKNTYKKTVFPSWCSVSDPVLLGRLKDIPTTGMVHGREAMWARDWDGYHKVCAGTEVKLPRIKKLPTGKRTLNEELLNPAGIQQILKKAGNYVLWGAQIPSTDPAFKFTQHRETLSYYEHVLMENFDYIIFAINDKEEWPGLLANLKSFFLPEWRKRAIRGDTFEQAAQMKIDEENNDNVTAGAGEMHAEIKVRIADTVEKFIMTVSKAGVFESLDG